MSLTLVEAPENEPLTLEQARLHIRLDSDQEDANVRRLIIAARQWVEGQTHRAMVSQTWDQVIDYGWPWRHNMPFIRMELNPVISVTSISYEDGSSPLTVLNATQYIAVKREHGSYIAPSYGVTWPTPRSVPEAVRVRFVAGYTTVPEPLKQAMAMLIAHWDQNRDIIVSGSTTEVPFGVESLISPYRG